MPAQGTLGFCFGTFRSVVLEIGDEELGLSDAISESAGILLVVLWVAISACDETNSGGR